MRTFRAPGMSLTNLSASAGGTHTSSAPQSTNVGARTVCSAAGSPNVSPDLSSARAAARRLLREGDGFGLPGVLRQVRAPTLVIWGADDTWIPVRDADKFVRDIPGARKVVIPECGHVPQEEKPHEVAALIADFLKTN